MKKDDFERLCRTCLATDVEMMPLVEKYLIKVLEDCTPVKLGCGLFKTKMICLNCRRILRDFDQMKKKCAEIEVFVVKFENDYGADMKNELGTINWNDGILNAFDESVKNEIEAEVKFEIGTNDNDEQISSDNDNNCSDDEVAMPKKKLKRGAKRKTKQIVKEEKLMRDIPWYSCNMCEEKFQILISLRRHIKEHFKERKCEYCHQDFDSIVSLTKHYPSHHEITPVIDCSQCEDKCYTKFELDYHTGMAHLLPSCPYCGKTFRSALKLDLNRRAKHLLKVHNIKIIKSTNSTVDNPTFYCPMCDNVRFASDHDLMRHISLEHKHVQPDIACWRCPELKFFVVEQLSEHHLQKHLTKDFKCPHCDKKLTNLRTLKRHFLTKHSSQKKSDAPTQAMNDDGTKQADGRSLCPICGKSVKHLESHHVNAHVKPKKIRCLICFEQMDTWKQLVSHRRENHAGVNPARTHQCDICHRWYPGQKNLYHHKKNSHSDQRPFNCTICSSTFKRARHLRLHMRQHTDERPYQCSFCDMKFRQTTTLNNHELIHKQQKPHRCDYCGVYFRQKVALTGHIASQHPGRKVITENPTNIVMVQAQVQQVQQSM